MCLFSLMPLNIIYTLMTPQFLSPFYSSLLNSKLIDLTTTPNLSLDV